MKKHLAIFEDKMGDLILNGVKTIEGRFSQSRITPFGAVTTGDLVYIKPSGKDIIGQFRVKKVIFFDGVDLSDLKEKYAKEMAVNESFWDRHKNAKYASLIFIGQVIPFITAPLKIPKKDLRGWVIL